MIVIGVDTHKRSHTLVALDAATGGVRGQLKIAATDDGTLEALRFAAELDPERVWAVEDCRHVSGRLERGLLTSYFPRKKSRGVSRNWGCELRLVAVV